MLRYIVVLAMLFTGACYGATATWTDPCDGRCTFNLYELTQSGERVVIAQGLAVSPYIFTIPLDRLGDTITYVMRASAGGIESADSNAAIFVVASDAPRQFRVVIQGTITVQ